MPLKDKDLLLQLLRADVVARINEKRSGKLPDPFPNAVTVEYEDTAAPIFDITDVKGVGGSIFRKPNTGEATYMNGDGEEPFELRFVKFEEYITQFRLDWRNDWSYGLSRPDFIVHTLDEPTYFLFHELSVGNIASKQSKACTQILNALRFLNGIPAFKDFMQGFTHKEGIISAKGCADTKTPRGMGAGFMMVYQELPDPKPIQNQSVERMGFSLWATNIVRLSRK